MKRRNIVREFVKKEIFVREFVNSDTFVIRDLIKSHFGNDETLNFSVFVQSLSFKTHREKLMETIEPFIANLDPNSSHLNELLLYGSQLLKETENKAILEASLQFIVETGRLQP